MYGLANAVKTKRINNRNKLGQLLGIVNGGPWYAIQINPNGKIIDRTSRRREQVVVLGGAELSDYRRSITFEPIVDKLVCYAGQFIAKIWFDGRFLIAKVAKGGIMACGKIYLESGISWADVMEQIGKAIYKAQDNYWRMIVLCYKILDGPKTYTQACERDQRSLFNISKNYRQRRWPEFREGGR